MPGTPEFNLYDVSLLLRKRIKLVVFFVLFVVASAALLLVFVLPPYYRSTVVIVAANPELGDKAWLFNKNIRQLNTVYGNDVDVDRLKAVANLDTIYLSMVNEFNLVKYYKLNATDRARQYKAANKLKNDVTIERSELGELRINVDAKDPALAANIANGISRLVQEILQNSWKNTYVNITTELKASRSTESLLSTDTFKSIPVPENLIGQPLAELQQAISENETASKLDIPALIVLEKAYPATVAHKPKKALVLVAAFLLALLFAVLFVVVFDRKR